MIVDLLEPLGQRHRVPPRPASQVQGPPARDGQKSAEPSVGPVKPGQFRQPLIVFGDAIEGLSLGSG